ncbi:MAG: alpha/beta fold hydrolase [Burkholderiales bacterium]|nr:alpha/beta fold hydrolase [Burkholderiales bacterium]
MTSRRATFVLAHGAWGGAHGLRHVRRLLRTEGHEISTPSLTGIGERVHLASPPVTLGTHVRDVVNHVLYEDLRGIVLVGFSYGGFVVTGALEHIADRVSHLVYLDAFVPASGESLGSHVRGEGRAKLALGEEWLVSGPVREFDDDAEAAWMGPRHAAASPDWRYREIATNHMVAKNRPQETARLLAEAAGASAR